MEIFVQLRANEKVPTNVNPYDTLLQLKQKIEVMYNIPVAQQMLVFAGNPMIDDDKVLLDYRLEKFSTVYLVLKLRGGCNNPDGVCTCNKQNPST
jgi:ubiquitin C